MLIYAYVFALVLGSVLLGASFLLGGKDMDHGHDVGHDVEADVDSVQIASDFGTELFAYVVAAMRARPDLAPALQ